MEPARIERYPEFWHHYLRAHSRPATRALHFFGIAAGAALAGWGLLFGPLWLAALFPLPGYGLAWLGHMLVERNEPATFGHPVWSFYSDFRMLALWLTGGLGRHLARAGIE